MEKNHKIKWGGIKYCFILKPNLFSQMLQIILSNPKKNLKYKKEKESKGQVRIYPDPKTYNIFWTRTDRVLDPCPSLKRREKDKKNKCFSQNLFTLEDIVLLTKHVYIFPLNPSPLNFFSFFFHPNKWLFIFSNLSPSFPSSSLYPNLMLLTHKRKKLKTEMQDANIRP